MLKSPLLSVKTKTDETEQVKIKNSRIELKLKRAFKN